jgi:transposase
MTSHHTWIGVDVSKRMLDVFTPALGAFRIDNTANGYEILTSKIVGLDIGGLVMEATGGYEQPLLRALAARGLPAAVVNPARVRAFATGTGQLAKTDRLDAEILAGYGAFKKPAPTPLPSSARANLKELLAYRAQVVAEITARKAQMQGFTCDALKARALAALAALKAERKALGTDIEALIECNEELQRVYTILTSTPAVGLIVAATLIAELPELGALSRRKIASLAGLAPFPRESGQKRGYRAIRGGRAEVRHALFNAARVALRFNPKIKPLAERLSAKSKPGKVVLVAAMRKLLTILNAMMKSQQTWTTA